VSREEEGWKQDATRSSCIQTRWKFKGRNCLKKGPNEMEIIAFGSEGVDDQVDSIETMVVDMVEKTKTPPGGGSTFVAKREC
jgi:hypothetical protein